jgi:hypothetical protein
MDRLNRRYDWIDYPETVGEGSIIPAVMWVVVVSLYLVGLWTVGGWIVRALL